MHKVSKKDRFRSLQFRDYKYQPASGQQIIRGCWSPLAESIAKKIGLRAPPTEWVKRDRSQEVTSSIMRLANPPKQDIYTSI